MAIYVPRARRRRNLIAVAVVAAVLGVGFGLAVGRASAPTVENRVQSVHSEARAIASQLRVISIHAEDHASSAAAGGDAGADLALRRTESNLRRLSRRAPWVQGKTAADLLSDTVALRASVPGHATTPEFGRHVDTLADRIESTFGATG